MRNEYKNSRNDCYGYYESCIVVIEGNQIEITV